jgi:hypothetical protein
MRLRLQMVKGVSMVMNNAERQRLYRQRALKDPDGLLLSRLQVMLSAHADGCLKRICEKTGNTKREVVEQALIELEKSLHSIPSGLSG